MEFPWMCIVPSYKAAGQAPRQNFAGQMGEISSADAPPSVASGFLRLVDALYTDSMGFTAYPAKVHFPRLLKAIENRVMPHGPGSKGA
jgi:hypothetical protein